MRARSALCVATVVLAAAAARGAHAEDARAAFSVGARVVRSARIQVGPDGAARVEADAGRGPGEIAPEKRVEGTRVAPRTVAVSTSAERTRDGHLLVTVFPDGRAPSLQVRERGAAPSTGHERR
jgi:hypothetical protein